MESMGPLTAAALREPGLERAPTVPTATQVLAPRGSMVKETSIAADDPPECDWCHLMQIKPRSNRSDSASIRNEVDSHAEASFAIPGPARNLEPLFSGARHSAFGHRTTDALWWPPVRLKEKSGVGARR